MKILVLDNYDSFTYNIVHILRELDDIDISVIKNDKIKINDVETFDKIILSPGPSLPKDAGKMNELILKYYNTKPILGICLGHQAIAENFGAKLYNENQFINFTKFAFKVLGSFSFISLISVQILKPSADQKLLCAQNRLCSSLPAICRFGKLWEKF